MFQRNNRKQRADESFLDRGPEMVKKSVHELPNYFAILGIIFVFGFGLLSRYFYLYLPKGLKIEDLASNPDKFIAERSFNDLKLLTEMGPRVTGTYNNEVLGVDFLKREISFIQQTANKRQNVTMDHQIVTGSYYGNFSPHGMTNMYQNVQNIVVKLKGARDKAVLLNCHFDSVAGSPGASDDAASCCIMLEVLRILSRISQINRHSIIFLFNGAEETPLQAAHGFVTQHPWIKEVQALVNLESVGSGGKEMLFQTGPKNPWLVDLYGKSAPHPNAQAAAEEVFQSGLIPSDTDFRIFRDYGNIPGLDFAHIINGYRYHTRFDHIDYLSLPVLQRTGENTLALTKELANSEILDDTKAHAEGQRVFFDFCGLIFLNYSKTFGVFVNLAVSLASMIVPCYFISRATRGIHPKHIMHEVRYSFFGTVAALALSGMCSYLVAYSVDSSGKSMAWYTHTWMAIGLYGVPTIVIGLAPHIWLTKKNSPISLGLKIQARLIGINAIHAMIALTTIIAGYRVGYVPMLIMVFYLLSTTIIGLMNLQNTIKTWLYVHLLCQIPTVLWSTQFYHILIMMFVPIAGRSGGFGNPDRNIGFILVGLTFLVTGYLVPLILLFPSKKRILIGFLASFLITRYVLINSGIEFPYRDDSTGHPTPQRLFVTHTIRHFYDHSGDLRNTDSGIWMRELDRNARKTIDSLSAPGLPIEQQDFCKNEVFCALPTYSCRQLHTGSFWLPTTSSPMIRKKAKLQLLSKLEPAPKTRQLNFFLSNEGVTSLQIRPKKHVELVKWNLIDHIPPQNFYNDQKGYFVMITHGVEPKPFNVTMEFKLADEAVGKSTVIDISVVTTHWEYHSEHTPVFNNLITKVPKWVFVVPSVAAVDVYEF